MNILGELLNEVEDVCFPTCFFEFLLSHFRVWLGCTKEDIEFDGT